MNRYLAVAATMALAHPAFAQGGGRMVLTNPESASGFESRAECETAIAAGLGRDRKNVGARSGRAEYRAGSLFNRARGNLSRCETGDGEYQIVVYPARLYR